MRLMEGSGQFGSRLIVVRCGPVIAILGIARVAPTNAGNDFSQKHFATADTILTVSPGSSTFS